MTMTMTDRPTANPTIDLPQLMDAIKTLGGGATPVAMKQQVEIIDRIAEHTQVMANVACDTEPENTVVSDNLQDAADMLVEASLKIETALADLRLAWKHLGQAKQLRLPKCEDASTKS